MQCIGIMHKDMLEFLGVGLEYKIIIDCADEVQQRPAFPVAFIIILHKSIHGDGNLSPVNFSFFSSYSNVYFHHVGDENPYFEEIPYVVGYPLPWGNLPFYAFSYRRVYLKILVLPEIKSPLEHELRYHPEKAVGIEWA